MFICIYVMCYVLYVMLYIYIYIYTYIYIHICIYMNIWISDKIKHIITIMLYMSFMSLTWLDNIVVAHDCARPVFFRTSFERLSGEDVAKDVWVGFASGFAICMCLFCYKNKNKYIYIYICIYIYIYIYVYIIHVLSVRAKLPFFLVMFKAYFQFTTSFPLPVFYQFSPQRRL